MIDELESKIVIEDGKPIKGFASFGRRVAAEGIVMLKNDNNTLPLKKDDVLSVFGRIQLHYYKSGTGSGGLVNVTHTTNIIEGILNNKKIKLNTKLLNIYKNWVDENPYNRGNGYWASEPWSQLEMELTDEIVSDARKESNVALIIIGRTAGEDKDNVVQEGSYLLSKIEIDMIKKVANQFERVIVAFNVGNIIDMSFLDEVNVAALLYIWHGGMEGGKAVADILSGDVSPSGKLSDTIAYTIDDYPSTKNFGSKKENIYGEDIYVGYRYFETFAKNKVRYPFGFGLSYTNFKIDVISVKNDDTKITCKVKVTNTGDYYGKEVVQIYYSAPQGKLGKPTRQLVAFAKTTLLQSGQSQEMTLSFSINDMVSYDDTDHHYILEKGNYRIYIGSDVRSATLSYEFTIKEDIIVAKLKEALAPYHSFIRIKPIQKDDEHFSISYEDTPKRKNDLMKVIESQRPASIGYKGDKGSNLLDVYNGKITLDEFISELSDNDLACLFRGEGMSSPKVTPGVASAFGGVTEPLLNKGISLCACADGPSGIRMDSGNIATSLPNGTLLACTWDEELIYMLYYLEGKELRAYNIDALLGPGINIHRNPLNGRNFEYFSEDPLLTGKIAASMIRGMQENGATGTLKHFAANNQEFGRTEADSVVSERALREIYLKGFEIAVKEANARSIMTSYNPINGIWAAGNYDLNTAILRDEWNYEGIVMTDWWAKMNDDQDAPSVTNTKAMIRAQNDLYMVVRDAANNTNNDNTIEALNNNLITRGEMERNARNILKFILKSPAFARLHNLPYKVEKEPTKPWFSVEKPKLVLAHLDDIIINGESLKDFNPLELDYKVVSQDLKDVTFKTSKDNITTKEVADDTVIIRVRNAFDAVTYRIRFVNNDEAKKTVLQEDPKIYASHAFIIEKNEHTYNMDEIKYVSKSDGIIIKEGILIKCYRNEWINFVVDVKNKNLYEFTFEIKSNDSPQAQIPFTVIHNMKVVSTIITNGSEGKWIKVKQRISLPQGVAFLKLHFNKSGIEMKSFTISGVY